MELKELTAYAAEKFQIPEQHKWADFPGFSVLADPGSGKWLALLMRQWDRETGEELERCDLKCGQTAISAPWISPPFRMQGKQWVGVRFDEFTERDAVFRLFDRAVYAASARGYTVVLDDMPPAPRQHADTPLLFTGRQLEEAEGEAPDRITRMRRLYDYGDGSFAQKSRNFYRQGKFMEDYTDDAPWTGTFSRYFPTYHELNLRQLRGYFTWRTAVRKGEYRPTAESFATIYLYELLNGIGTDSPTESLNKLLDFERGFLDAGYGSDGMRKNLRRWMLEFAVLRDLPAETARACADPELIARDEALAVLRESQDRPDGEIFEALSGLAWKDIEKSPLFKQDAEKGRRLFASVWRGLTDTPNTDGTDVFTRCFGEQREYPWHPLGSAVYYEAQPHPAADYALNASRSYTCRDGHWLERRYDPPAFDPTRFQGLVHEIDRQLRQRRRTGHYLKEHPAGAWAKPLVEAAILRAEEKEREAARPRIKLDLSGLARIRRDAEFTRDSLLTEAELDAAPMTEPAPKPQKAPEDAVPTPVFDGLDAAHLEILLALLRGETAAELMAARRLMPNLVADTINAAFLDEVGDSVVECDGGAVNLVEDYREDVRRIVEGGGT